MNHEFISIRIPICDHATITFDPHSNAPDRIITLFQQYTSLELEHGNSYVFRLLETNGTIKLDYYRKYRQISITGKCLVFLRSKPEMHSAFLQIFNDESGYNITRFDATMDLSIAFHKIKDQYLSKFPDMRIQIGATNNKLRRIMYLMGMTDYGHHTGTIQLQDQKYKGDHKFVIYDKQQELLDKNELSIPPTTRYEQRLSKKGATVHDILNAESIFWHFMPDSLIKNPTNAPKWQRKQRYAYQDITPFDDAERFAYRSITSNAALQALVKQAHEQGYTEDVLSAFIELIQSPQAINS